MMQFDETVETAVAAGLHSDSIVPPPSPQRANPQRNACIRVHAIPRRVGEEVMMDEPSPAPLVPVWRTYFAALTCHPESRTENRLRRCGSHCDDQVWLDDSQFRLQPGAARCDFARVRLLMDSAFPAGLPFEVFDRVRHVNLRPINSGVLERAIHDFSGRTHEWFARHIFVVARLFANQHHHCALRAFAKHSLRSSLVQMTCGTASCCFAHGSQTRCIRRLGRSRVCLFVLSHPLTKNRKSCVHCLLLPHFGEQAIEPGRDRSTRKTIGDGPRPQPVPRGHGC